jgi:hypothetical protein
MYFVLSPERVLSCKNLFELHITHINNKDFQCKPISKEILIIKLLIDEKGMTARDSLSLDKKGIELMKRILPKYHFRETSLSKLCTVFAFPSIMCPEIVS